MFMNQSFHSSQIPILFKVITFNHKSWSLQQTLFSSKKDIINSNNSFFIVHLEVALSPNDRASSKSLSFLRHITIQDTLKQLFCGDCVIEFTQNVHLIIIYQRLVLFLL